MLPYYCTGHQRKDTKKGENCPRCGGKLPIGYPGALSRRDNKTEICSDCGMIEAFIDFVKAKRKEK
jgi:rRNA maturation protein Nop10